ncbi:hypothetical protein CDEF62S_01397 [Castellaniella defragrans]
MEVISAAEANRQFSSLLRRARAGVSTTILSRGEPVATLAPYTGDTSMQQAARNLLLQRLASQAPEESPQPWTRDELYERR